MNTPEHTHFHCGDCGEAFLKEEAIKEESTDHEPQGEGVVPRDLTLFVCPDCGSDELEEFTPDDDEDEEENDE